jgi:hypothetical protein
MKTLRLGPVVALLVSSILELVHVPQAHAVVGRPLTPVSVAGVARRTARRCAVGVYYCQIDTPRSRESSRIALRQRERQHTS